MDRFMIILAFALMAGLISWLIGNAFGTLVQVIVTFPLAVIGGLAARTISDRIS